MLLVGDWHDLLTGLVVVLALCSSVVVPVLFQNPFSLRHPRTGAEAIRAPSVVMYIHVIIRY